SSSPIWRLSAASCGHRLSSVSAQCWSPSATPIAGCARYTRSRLTKAAAGDTSPSRRQAQPAPGELHDDAADAGIAVLADPLLALDAATAERRAGETGETGDGPAVAEWPAQHLADQHGGSLQAEGD